MEGGGQKTVGDGQKMVCWEYKMVGGRYDMTYRKWGIGNEQRNTMKKILKIQSWILKKIFIQDYG